MKIFYNLLKRAGAWINAYATLVVYSIAVNDSAARKTDGDNRTVNISAARKTDRKMLPRVETIKKPLKIKENKI